MDKYRVEIKNLTDQREMSAKPQDADLSKPDSWMENTAVRDNGQEVQIDTFPNHLLCDEEGAFPAEMTSWERKVFDVETRRKGFSNWYSNPGRPSQDSVGIPYEDTRFRVKSVIDELSVSYQTPCVVISWFIRV